MPTLFRTTCSTDWKGRPTHNLAMLGTGTLEELLALQDADVAQWQHEDIVADKEDEDDAVDEEREPRSILDEWHIEDERWEMARENPTDLRVFAEQDGDGGTFSIAYHIVN